MIRSGLALCLAGVMAGTSAAADPPPKGKLSTFSVSPAAAPVPALKYELLPRLRDCKPGNRELEYARAFELRPRPLQDWAKETERRDKIDKWLETPADQLKVAEVKEFLKGYAHTLRPMDTALHLDRYETRLWEDLRTEGVNLLLPSLQTHRDTARILQLRHHVELAEGRFEDANRTQQVMMRAAKDVGESPTLIAMLVGFGLTMMDLAGVEQWMQKPDSPNLYWALTTLPRPLIDPRPSMEGESLFFSSVFHHLKEIDSGPLSTERANDLLLLTFQELKKTAEIANPDAASKSSIDALGKVTNSVALAVYVMKLEAESRKYLIADGMKPDVVAKLPAAQAVAMRSMRLVRRLTDEQLKCFMLPFPQGYAESKRVTKEMLAMRKANEADVIFQLAWLVMPAMQAAQTSYARVDRVVAILRVIEAIRMHAVANSNKPPKSLADITVVPVPEDPWTGKPFEYTADGQKFTLVAPPPTGEKPTMSNNLRYEITVREK